MIMSAIAGMWWTHMAYSSNGARLFSCGVSAGSDSTLVEWNESDGAIARRFSGFRNTTGSLTRFDTANNKYLVVGDDHSVKVCITCKVDVLAVPVKGLAGPGRTRRIIRLCVAARCGRWISQIR